MRSFLACLLIGAAVAAPCAFAAERFTAETATPLKRLPPAKDDGNGVRFGGSVQLTGQFFMVWKRENGRPVYRQITFYPDVASTARLPHPVGEKAVGELDFTNREQAGAMLRELVTAEKPLPRDETGSSGAATVTIRDYRTTVECDHRWYLAELVSAVGKDIVVGARDLRPGC